MVAVAAGVVLAGEVPGQSPGEVEVRMVRFYRGDATLVDGFCRVPFRLIETLPADGEPGGAYRVVVRVQDSAGLELHTSSWSQSVPAAVLGMPGASAVEHFAFAARPGRYTVSVTVTDSASGRVLQNRTNVAAFAVQPRVSDPLLAAAMRRAGGADTVTAAGEIKKGALFITSATRPVLTPRQATLYYYLEVYARTEARAAIVARVLDADGRQIIAAAPQEVAVPAGGGVATSGLDLTGLPPGGYRMALEVSVGDTTVTRGADFVMADFATDAALAAAAAAPAADRFAHLTGAQLDSLYAPLIHLMEDAERGIFDGLSVEGRRNYLRRFWERRDPTPGTGENEALDEYYERIAEANRRYREGGSAETPGWRTDRGRIFIRYGEAEQMLDQPQPEGRYPYIVWKYTRGRQRKFVFMDETGFGHYTLVYTDERREPSWPNWEGYFHEEDLRRILNF